MWTQMWPQAKINLVTVPPDSDSLVTQVGFAGPRFTMSEEGGAQIFRALPGDSSRVRGQVVRQRGWLLLGGLSKARTEPNGKDFFYQRERRPAQNT